MSSGFPRASQIRFPFARADHLLGRDAVAVRSEGADELHAAARNNERLEAVRPEILQELEHRLIDKLIEGGCVL